MDSSFLFELRYILTVANAGSISKAAEELFMAQSSLSQFLSRFEKRIGFKLFTRTSRGVLLTSSGVLFIEAANKIIAIMEECQKNVDTIQKTGINRVLRFGISPYRIPLIFPKFQQLLTDTYPDIRLEIVESGASRLEKLLLESKIDCAVLGLPLENNKLSYVVVKDENIILGCCSQHPVCEYAHKQRNNQSWIDYRHAFEYPLILLDRSSRLRMLLDPLIKETNPRPNVVHQTSNILNAIDLASKGIGITFLPAAFVRNVTFNMSLFLINNPPLTRSLVLAYSHNMVADSLLHDIEHCLRVIFDSD